MKQLGPPWAVRRHRDRMKLVAFLRDGDVFSARCRCGPGQRSPGPRLRCASTPPGASSVETPNRAGEPATNTLQTGRNLSQRAITLRMHPGADLLLHDFFFSQPGLPRCSSPWGETLCLIHAGGFIRPQQLFYPAYELHCNASSTDILQPPAACRHQPLWPLRDGPQYHPRI